MAGLQFSDTSTRQGLIQDCEDNLNFPAAGISGNTTLLQTFTRYINIWYHKVVTMIINSQDSWDFDDSTITTTYPIATRAMVASQRDYKFTSALWSMVGAEGASAGANAAITPLKIKRVDFTYDGSTWYKAELFDTGMTGVGLGNDTNTDGNFSPTKPYYDLSNNALNVYPLATAANVSAGAKIRIEFTRYVTEFTTASTTAQPGFDITFHRMLSLGASINFGLPKSLPQIPGLQAELMDYEQRLKQSYGQKDTDSQFRMSAAYITYE